MNSHHSMQIALAGLAEHPIAVGVFALLAAVVVTVMVAIDRRAERTRA